MVELNGDRQGSDNGSNLLVRFLGRLSQKFVFCPISVVRYDRMPKEKKQLMWELIEDKISEHLTEDQELAISYGISLKIVAHPNDAIVKMFGFEHSGRMRGLGGNVCPSKAFEMSKNSHVDLGSLSSIFRQRVEDLEKQYSNGMMIDLHVVSGMEKLNNNNYNTWSTCIMLYMQGQDLWDIVNGTEVAQPEVVDANGTLTIWKIKARKAMFALKITVEKDLL
ncbi:putative protein TOPLESS [Capsicum annuum]|nr:putative protein TOPLESS [Capsicum annuum]